MKFRKKIIGTLLLTLMQVSVAWGSGQTRQEQNQQLVANFGNSLLNYINADTDSSARTISILELNALNAYRSALSGQQNSLVDYLREVFTSNTENQVLAGMNASLSSVDLSEISDARKELIVLRMRYFVSEAQRQFGQHQLNQRIGAGITIATTTAILYAAFQAIRVATAINNGTEQRILAHQGNWIDVVSYGATGGIVGGVYGAGIAAIGLTAQSIIQAPGTTETFESMLEQ